MDCRKLLGFTLLELLVAMSIVMVMLLIVIPTGNDFIRTSYLSAQMRVFLSAANYARTEAIQRKLPVGLCIGSEGYCHGGLLWEQGWLVFVDNNHNRSLDRGELIRVFDGLHKGYTLRPNVRVSSLMFLANGVVRRANRALPLMTFRLCAPDASTGNLLERSREIVINATGRMRLQPGREKAGAC